MSDRRVTFLLRAMFYVALTLFMILLVAGIIVSKVGAAEWRPFLDAVRHEESRGDDRAVGDGGRSRGPVQCGRAAWADACEYMGVDWDYDKCVWLRFESEAVVIAYTQRWGARTWEERARCWNSGPKWRRKYRLTNGYWRRVKARMDRSER